MRLLLGQGLYEWNTRRPAHSPRPGWELPGCLGFIPGSPRGTGQQQAQDRPDEVSRALLERGLCSWSLIVQESNPGADTYRYSWRNPGGPG